MDLSRYDGKRICVLLKTEETTVPACGVAVYETDESLGGALRVALDSPEGVEGVDLFISESQWKGEITTESDLDCDFCFVPASEEESD